MLPSWHETLYRIFLESSLRVSVIAIAVAMILVAVRARAGSVRHAAWTAVLCAMLLMPILPYCVPPITIPFTFTAGDVVPSAAIESRQVFPGSAAEAQSVSDSTGSTEQTIPATALAVAPAPAAAHVSALTWPSSALIIYGFGVSILLCHLFLGWRGMVQIARRSHSVNLAGCDFADDLSRFPLFESEMVAAPVTVGILSPRVVLPVAWSSWPGEKLHAILAHEIAHVHRRDTLVGFLAHLNRCIFWFHPLAWWLERKLAATAEHACDDAAVRAIGKTRNYAEVLLDMAEAVRQSGKRFSWQGVGVGGTGLLGRRIDRILHGDLFREMSRPRKAVVAVGCAAAIFIIVACRQQPRTVAPLQEDPKYTEQQAQQKAQSEFRKAAHDMNSQQVANLEAALKKNPEDLDALKKLLTFYLPLSEQVPGEKGKWAPICAQVLGEKDCIAARRPHILWLIEHHAEDKLAGGWEARIYPTSLDPLPDPVGYAQARKLWLEQTSRPDATVAMFKNASYFFEVADKQLAEKMMLHARALDPKGSWSYALGRLYAFALLGSNSSTPLNVVRTVSTEDMHGPYAQEIRKKLDTTTDSAVLTAAASYLTFARPLYADKRVDFDPVALGKHYIERAVQLDPQSEQARGMLRNLAEVDRNLRIREVLRNVPKESQRQTIAALLEAERFSYLPWLAIEAFLEGENADYYRKDQSGAKAAWERSRAYAQDMLQLAPKLRDDPEYGTAVYVGNIVLGLITFREGNRQAAIEHMLAASHAPASESLDRYLSWNYKLTGYLLKYGERDSVIEFLERIAQVAGPQEKQYLLESAGKIRQGLQPSWYPRESANTSGEQRRQ